MPESNDLSWTQTFESEMMFFRYYEMTCFVFLSILLDDLLLSSNILIRPTFLVSSSLVFSGKAGHSITSALALISEKYYSRAMLVIASLLLVKDILLQIP